MVSREHEAPILLVRERPELVAELLRDWLAVVVPSHSEARVEAADFTQVFPVEFRADAVVTLRQDGQPVMGIILEVQRGEDDDKRGSWPLYNAAFHAQIRCQIALVVIAEDENVARWAAKPIMTLQAGSAFTPLVLGPSRVPVVTSEEQACRAPELAVLSALVHGKKRGLEVGRAAARAALSLDLPGERRTLYLDLILSALAAEPRATLEIEMDLSGYKFKSETFRRQIADAQALGEAKGEARAVLTVLSARKLAVSEELRAKILACTDLAVLERWIERAATASSTEDVVQE
ncbi:hypothetical protein LVJ94_15750 [Pendulispora rubella]|uniref:DUF4351 domain-containing protein n=1 Tax=Pendulispora rubella TaxID=2741070 RepID=A0ABZ2LFK9_9BACT